MKEARIYVDLNEMLERDLVLLSRVDERLDSCGNTVQLHEGLKIKIYMDDLDQHGNEDNLIGDGLVEQNPLYGKDHGWGHVKWCCRIEWLKNESEIR